MPAKPRIKGRRWQHELQVVGLRYRGWSRSGREVLAQMIEKRGSIKGMRLVREPDNPADEHAIAVYLPPRIAEGKQLGYLYREPAALLAPKIDAGTLVVVGAELEELDAEDDWNAGTMLVRFVDVKPTAKTRKKAPSR